MIVIEHFSEVREVREQIGVDEDGAPIFEMVMRRVEGQREIEVPGVITESEAIERDRLAAIDEHNAAIRARLAANDLNVIRAVIEGDTARIEQHKAAQAELRAKLK